MRPPEDPTDPARSIDTAELPGLAELDRYKIVCCIGRGSHGVVFEGFDRNLERSVAIKVMTAWKSIEDIEREAFGLASVEHPNVVTVHDLSFYSGLGLLVMERVHGETIYRRAPACTDWRELVGWYAQAARGLQAIHDAGLIHGDLKPSNIIVDHGGRARILDFSLCCRIGERAHGGTRDYLPPERASCELADPRGDQYSLAAALADSLRRLAPPPDVPALAKLLGRAMATEPDDRFATLTALAEGLERVRARSSVRAVMRTRGGRARRHGRARARLIRRLDRVFA